MAKSFLDTLVTDAGTDPATDAVATGTTTPVPTPVAAITVSEPAPDGFSWALPVAEQAYAMAVVYAATNPTSVGYYGAVNTGINASATLSNVTTTVSNNYFTVTATDAVKPEGTGGTTDFTFTITRVGDLTGTASANWGVPKPSYSLMGSTLVVGDTRVSDADFVGGVLPTGVVYFADGQATQTVTISVVADSRGENDEIFSLAINNAIVPDGVTNWQYAVGTILNDDTTYSIAAGTAQIGEGTGGTRTLAYTVTRIGDISGTGTVDWSVAGSGAHPVTGADLVGGVLPGGTLTFAPGVTTQTIILSVATDAAGEVNEDLTLSLANPSGGANIDVGAFNSTIFDDDVLYIFDTKNSDTIVAPSTQALNAIVLNQGGADKVTGGSQGDLFLFGGAFTGSDKVNGGAGFDILSLMGNYSAGVTLGTSTLLNVEGIYFAAGFNYKLTTNNATVAAGQTLVVDASALASINSATVNGTSETNGSFVFLGGAGNDNFTGGGMADTFVGGLGADILVGRAGADLFIYGAAADSPLQTSAGSIVVTGDDKLTNFQAGSDRIDLSAFGFGGAAAAVITTSTTGFSTGLGSGAGYFGTAGVAVEYASSGNTARLYVDADKDGNLGVGDLLIQLTGVAKSSIGASSIIF